MSPKTVKAPPRIQEVAMLVGLRQQMWRAIRTDEKVSQDVAKQHGSKREMGNYNKFLIDPKALRPIESQMGKARAEHHALTLPWQDGGFRILSSAMYFKYSEKMREHQAEYWKLVGEFLPLYDALKRQAKKDLNGLFDPADYPDVGEIRNRFVCNINVLPMPDAADFRVQLGEAETERVRQNVKQGMDQMLNDAMRDIWVRMQEVVSHMVERLQAYHVTKKGKVEHPFRDTLITNIEEMLEIVPLLNITQDPNVTQFCTAIREQLLTHGAEVLRDDAKARTDVTKRAEEILNKMQSFLA